MCAGVYVGPTTYVCVGPYKCHSPQLLPHVPREHTPLNNMNRRIVVVFVALFTIAVILTVTLTLCLRPQTAACAHFYDTTGTFVHALVQFCFYDVPTR